MIRVFMLHIFDFGYKEIMIICPGQVFSLNNTSPSMNGKNGIRIPLPKKILRSYAG